MIICKTCGCECMHLEHIAGATCPNHGQIAYDRTIALPKPGPILGLWQAVALLTGWIGLLWLVGGL